MGVLIENLTVNLYATADMADVHHKLDQLLALARSIKKEEKILEQEMIVMQNVIAAVKTVEDSAATLITGMAVKIAALAENATSLAQMKADAATLAQSLSDSAIPLSQAVTANTEVAPAPPPAPQPEQGVVTPPDTQGA